MIDRPPPANPPTRAAPRGQTPPVNLKERIAALQQRSVSPNTHQSAQAVPRGLPSPNSGGLRDKIAKFEEKGGIPVPRGSFAVGAPQLAENAPPKKRGELYGNRVPGLGRPTGTPVSRSGSPLPPTDEPPGPRKRCISTGTGLSSRPPSFSTDEPVPPLPNGLFAPAPRRNSLAVNFGSGRRAMSTSDAESKAVDFVDASSPSPSSLVPEKPPEKTEEQPPGPEESSPAAVGETQPAVQEPQLSCLEAPEETTATTEPPIEQPSPTDVGTSEADTPAGDSPAPKNHAFPLYDASRNVSRSSTVGRGSKDGLPEYESTPPSAVSQSSPPHPEPTSSAPSPIPADIPFPTPTPSAAPAETVVTLTPEKATKPIAASRDSTITISVPSPEVSILPSIPTPTPTTETRSQGKATFKAIVHRKVSEPLVASPPASLAPPETRQRRSVSGNVVEVPASPGHGDLANLLEDAALLELRLTEGDSTGLRAKEVLANTPTPTSATFQTDPRYESASTLTEHVPPPSSDSGSQSVRSMSIPSIREPLIDGEIPEGEETDGRSLASTTFSQRSPHRKYLSNIYRLTSRRSSGYMPGTYPRDSMSMSSEDSSPVTTPSDNGKRKGFGIAWPSGSPKKGGPNASRSSSFADKIFNRNRTKSNVSTADQGTSRDAQTRVFGDLIYAVSERNSIYESSQPSLTISFPPDLSPGEHPVGVDMDARHTSWISPTDSNPEYSPASSLLDKDIFDAFPSVPQTLPPGFHLDAENAGMGRASTLPVSGRKQVNQRLSMV